MQVAMSTQLRAPVQARVASTRRPARRCLAVRATVETLEKPAEAVAEEKPQEPVASTSSSSAAQPALRRPHAKGDTSNTPDLLEVMSFNGALPEIANGRLAMLGFLAAFGCELFTGKSVGQQLATPGTFGTVFWAVLLVSAATAAPILNRVENKEAFGPLTPEKELFNARAAMVGYAALVLIEAFRGSALF